ncbi:MAG: hypothetical protein CV087_22515 [Candidatus Brocadia sp. WS118]|nr:MAG: hypothetical protein CV087_22515 [Candidatus Brocadia sp. WS118]
MREVSRRGKNRERDKGTHPLIPPSTLRRAQGKPFVGLRAGSPPEGAGRRGDTTPWPPFDRLKTQPLLRGKMGWGWKGKKRLSRLIKK